MAPKGKVVATSHSMEEEIIPDESVVVVEGSDSEEHDSSTSIRLDRVDHPSLGYVAQVAVVAVDPCLVAPPAVQFQPPPPPPALSVSRDKASASAARAFTIPPHVVSLPFHATAQMAMVDQGDPRIVDVDHFSEESMTVRVGLMSVEPRWRDNFIEADPQKQEAGPQEFEAGPHEFEAGPHELEVGPHELEAGPHELEPLPQMLEAIYVGLGDFLRLLIFKRHTKVLKNGCEMSCIGKRSMEIFPSGLRDYLVHNHMDVYIEVLLHAIDHKSLNIYESIPATTLGDNIFCKGSVDTTILGVNTMVKNKGRNVKKSPSQVDTSPEQVDTRDRFQRNKSTDWDSRSL
ncbi:hypothetical protein Taro_033169 [Colocasia esculenta]|uniref:Uncharacterized protein n=1 Tax=Colocasia esculenta TaxID=4460 RepID=A0A843VZD8_COLES|nr:hypothetical protein [Colocasia esculenta]